MSDTKIGRSSISTPHGLSRFGRRSAGGGRRADHTARASAVLGSDVQALAEVAMPIADRTALQLPVVRAEAPAEVVGPTDLPVAGAGGTLESTVAVPASRRPAAQILPLAAVLGLAAAVALGAPVLAALLLTVVWVLIAAQQSPSALVPGLPAWRGLPTAAAATVATAGVAVGLLDSSRVLVSQSLAMVAVASLAAVAPRLLRRVPRRRIVVVGGGADLAAAAARWLGHGEVQVVGAMLTSHEDDPDLDVLVASIGVPVAHDAADLGDLLDRTGAELVVVCGAVDEASLRQAAWLLERRPVGLALAGPLDSVSPHRVAVTAFGGATLTHVRSSRPTRWTGSFKTALDRLAGLALLAAVAPVMGALALWIRLDSPGPVFFRQTRVGHHGRHFTMWKLRTMVVDAEHIKATLTTQNEGAGLLFKMQSDPRITASGRILRKLSLDELPQLINVVLGHMSLVGPRPALPAEVARYDAVTRRRLASKPGITGLWQVSGRSDLSWDESIRLDLHYTDNWRIRDDASILFRTAGAVLKSRGAY